MNSDVRWSLVKDSLDLLRQVRAGMHDESNRSLVGSLDQAIGLLEGVKREDCIDANRVNAVLKVLAQGLAALSVVEHLIEWMDN